MSKINIEIDRNEIIEKIVTRLFDDYPEQNVLEKLIREEKITYDEYEKYMKVAETLRIESRLLMFGGLAKLVLIGGIINEICSLDFNDEK